MSSERTDAPLWWMVWILAGMWVQQCQGNWTLSQIRDHIGDIKVRMP